MNLKLKFYCTDGKRDGSFKEWYQNGQLNVEGSYAIGEKDGSFKVWDDNGNITMLSNYIKGKITSNKCTLNGDIFGSNCTKYFGDCRDNKANGWGTIYLNNNDSIKGVFVDNKIANFCIERYDISQNKLKIGPNKGLQLHGPGIEIYKINSVEFKNYVNDQWAGGRDYFQIPPPNFNFTGIFCDAQAYSIIDKSGERVSESIAIREGSGT